MTLVQVQKQALRHVMKDKRRNEAPRNSHAPKTLCDLFLRQIRLSCASIVGIYKPSGDEMDAMPLAGALCAVGHSLALPVLAGKERGLVFRRYAIGDDLALNRFGIEEPIDTAPIVKPDFLLVPMLAFDRQCYRLGYGGGYYDRTIKELRQNRGIMAIGLAFSFQEVREIPRNEHDEQLDKIVTEIQIFQR